MSSQTEEVLSFAESITALGTGEVSGYVGQLSALLEKFGRNDASGHPLDTPYAPTAGQIDYSSAGRSNADMGYVIQEVDTANPIVGYPQNRSTLLADFDTQLNTGFGKEIFSYPAAAGTAMGAFNFPLWDVPGFSTTFAEKPYSFSADNPDYRLTLPNLPLIADPAAPTVGDLTARPATLSAPLAVQKSTDLVESPLPGPLATLPESDLPALLDTLPESALPADFGPLLESDLPSAPVLTLPAFALPEIALPLPTVDYSVPSNTFAYMEDAYNSKLATAIQDALWSDIFNGQQTGIDPAIEQALWERDKDRTQAALQDTLGGIVRGYAARGFPVPTGELRTLQWQASNAAAQEMSARSRDIAIKRSDLYVQARQFAIQQGVSWETIAMQYTGQMLERRLNVSRLAAEFGLKYCEAQAKLAQDKRELWRLISEVQTEQVGNALRGLETYKAEFLKIDAEAVRNDKRLDAYRASFLGIDAEAKQNQTRMEAQRVAFLGVDAEAKQNQTRLDAYKAGFLVNDAEVERNAKRLESWNLANQAVAAMEGIRQTQIKQAELAVAYDDLQLRHDAQLTANFLAVHQGTETAVSAFAEIVKAQLSKNEPVKLSLDIAQADAEMSKASAGLSKDRFDAEAERYRQNFARYQQDMQNFFAMLAQAMDRVKLLADGDNKEALALQELLINTHDKNNQWRLAEAELRIRETLDRFKQYLAHHVAAQKSQTEKDAVSVQAYNVIVQAMEALLRSGSSMVLGVAQDMTST